MSTKNIKAGSVCLGGDAPVFIIAEMSANHNHDYNKAVELVDAAKAAGADAVKIQTYTADTLTLNCDNEHFQIGAGTIWEGRTLYDLYEEAHTPWDWQPKLKEYAESIGLILFSTPFDATAVDFLEDMDVALHKIASFEVVDIPLIEKVAATGKPVIMSTGMSSEEEIEEAVDAFRGAGGQELILLKCTSAYPAPPEDMNLKTIPYLADKFGVTAGLSDHTLGADSAIAAVALGAKVIEKHMTLRRSDGGPDSAFSMEPDEFAEMVKSIRTVEKALGAVQLGVKGEEKNSKGFRKSIFVAESMKAGDVLTEKNIRVVRPGYGLHPRYFKELLGKVAAQDVEFGTPLAAAHVTDFEEK